MALRSGKPLLVLTAYTDQPFWGHRVFDGACGPEPLRMGKVTGDVLTDKIKELLRPEYAGAAGAASAAGAAAALGAKIREEPSGMDALLNSALENFSVYEPSARCELVQDRPAV
jgi:UDP:flavonoid glycosyltransferase YjiC (YdhE family)